MGKEDFKQIQIVGDVRQALMELEEYLREPPQLVLSTKALKKFNALEKRYDEFYKLSLDERLEFAGYKTKAKL